MNALTLWQPWASLVATGAKKWETRSWATSYRGPLLICSAKKGLPKAELEQFLDTPECQAGLADLWNYPPSITGSQITGVDLSFGYAECVVDLVACIGTRGYLRGELGPQELSFGDFSDGRFAWKLENPRRLTIPTQVTGRQGLWEIPDAWCRTYGIIN